MRSSRNSRGRGYRGRGGRRGRGGYRGGSHPRNTNVPRQFIPTNMPEVLVGITEYISDNKGFTGVLKSRYSDFHVNEIDLSGNVIQLDDFTVPIAKVDGDGKFSQLDINLVSLNPN